MSIKTCPVCYHAYGNTKKTCTKCGFDFTRKEPVTLTATTIQELVKHLQTLKVNDGSFLVERGAHGYATIMVYDKHGQRVADISNK